MHDKIARDRYLRADAARLFAHLPDDPAEARRVLGYAREILDGGFIERDDSHVVSLRAVERGGANG